MADINLSPDRNPKYNSNINPKYNSNINPKYNSNINPKYNSNINYKYNSNINPKYNSNINPKYNSNINPKYNSNINPKYNSNINPKYNTNINPKYNRDLPGLYTFSNDGSVNGFVIFTSNVGIVFNNNNELIGYLIRHNEGLNSYNADMLWTEVWLRDSQSGYNIFSLNNDWIGYAN